MFELISVVDLEMSKYNFFDVFHVVISGFDR